MHDLKSDAAQIGARPKGRRLWFLIVVALLAGTAISIVQFRPELERNFKGWLIFVIVALTLVLVLIWFAFLSRFPWRVRLIAIAAVALAGFGISKSVRVTGTISSIGFPRLAWKWTRERALPLDSALVSAPAPANAANIPDVPQFFGPNRDGIITGAKLARDWNSSPPRQLWRKPIGAGWSAFAVAAGYERADPIIGLLITLVILKITWDSWRVISTTV